MTNESSPEPGKSLFSLQRRERLMEELRAHGAITVRDIAAKLGVSELTIRRDVNTLADEGLDVVPGSACSDDRLAVAVSGYATDGSGSGTVRLAIGTDAPQVLSVRRQGRDWTRTDGP